MSENYVEEKEKSFIDSLNETERKNGILYADTQLDSERFLSLTSDELTSMSYEQCISTKYAILQHSLKIQRAMNRAVAIRNWANRNLEIVISKEIVYDGTFFKHEVKRDQIITKNSYAKALNDIVLREQANIDILNNTSQIVKEFSSVLTGMIYNKREINGTNN